MPSKGQATWLFGNGVSASTVTWPPLSVLTAMLKEGRDVWVAELLKCDRVEVRRKRLELDITGFERGGSSIDRNNAREKFMAKWRKAVTPPATGAHDPTKPLTPDALEQAIRQYYADEGRRPDTERLARRIGRSATEVQKAFAELMKTNYRIRYEAGLMTLPDWSAGEYVLPTSRIEHPKIESKPTLLKPDPPTEVHDEMNVKPDYERDKALVQEYADLESTGAKNLYSTLAERHGVKTGTYSARLSAARHRLNAYRNGQDVYGTGAKQRVRFQCEACRDSGLSNEDGTRFCSCAVGRRLAEKDAALNPPAAQPATEPLTTEPPTEGVSTPDQSEAPTSPTVSDTAISTTVPTAQQVEAIAADLTGHQPTQAEVEEMLGNEQVSVVSAGAPVLLAEPGAVKSDSQRVKELEWALGEYRKANDCLKQEVAALTATLEQAAAGATATTFLLVDSDGTMRAMESADDLATGDEWAETVRVNGLRQVRVWQCASVWVLHGTVLCLLVPQGFVLGALPVMQREVA